MGDLTLGLSLGLLLNCLLSSLLVRFADRFWLSDFRASRDCIDTVGMVAFVGVDVWCRCDLHFLKGEGLDVKFEVWVKVLDVLVKGAFMEEGLWAAWHWAKVLVTICFADMDLHMLFEI